jgi:hypothetical protein
VKLRSVIVVATIAAALVALGRARDAAEADGLAGDIWRARG